MLITHDMWAAHGEHRFNQEQVMTNPCRTPGGKAREFARNLLRNTTGAAAIMAGVAIPAVLGTAALAIDVGN